MKSAARYIFHGHPTRRPQNPHPDSPDTPEPYVVSDDLKRAVNLAIFLGRPLLLEGEAGCGKTRLAYAVAYELGLPLYRWDVRSTDKAQHGFYTYDAIRRLYDVHVINAASQNQAAVPPENLRPPNPADPKNYREKQALYKAFSCRGYSAVVLIDEIDKAEIDFPNDLLAVLEPPRRFFIPETNETIEADPEYPPIVLITSNKEKGNLPAPFLRRCIYHFVSFPETDDLMKIVAQHYELSDAKAPPSDLVGTAIERFLDMRDKGGLYKKPGTSEFIDWLHALHQFEEKPYSPAKIPERGPFPYSELLFKLRDDWRRMQRAYE